MKLKIMGFAGGNKIGIWTCYFDKKGPKHFNIVQMVLHSRSDFTAFNLRFGTDTVSSTQRNSGLWIKSSADV